MSIPLAIQWYKRFVCSIWDRIVITFRRENRETTLHHSCLSLNKKVFPDHRPGGLKRADWDFFFMIFEKSFFFSQPSWYILVNEKLKTEKKYIPDLPTGFLGSQPADRKQFCTGGLMTLITLKISWKGHRTAHSMIPVFLHFPIPISKLYGRKCF